MMIELLGELEATRSNRVANEEENLEYLGFLCVYKVQHCTKNISIFLYSLRHFLSKAQMKERIFEDANGWPDVEI
jgi:hypothetical protein